MGGFGAPDRGGSREGKKSLRGNKQALQKLVKDEQKGHVKAAPRPTLSEKPPPALPPTSGERALVDAAAQLTSRQFDRDQFKVLQRAASAGVGPIIAYTTDDAKLEALVRTAKENAGQVYCVVGVHSDNIKRANDRLSPARLEQLKDLALEASCVGVLAGLAFRDVGIRYAQERALTEQMELAAGVGLPLVLYEVRAAEVLAERISEFRCGGAGEGRAATTPIAIFNFGGSREELTTFLELGCHIVLTGRVCDSTERGEQLRELAALIPRDRIMLASDSPFTTPQNIPDVFVREGRNEPSNLPYVLEALAPALGVTSVELAAATRRNTLKFFGVQEAAEAAAEANAQGEADAAAAAATTATSTAEAGSKPVASPSASSSKSHLQQPQQRQQEPSSGAVRRKKMKSVGLDLAPCGAGTGTDGGRKGEEGRVAGNEEEDEGEERGDGGGRSREQNKRRSCRNAARAANLFALMKLREGDGEDYEEEDGDDDVNDDDDDDDDDDHGDNGGGDKDRIGSGAAATSTSLSTVAAAADIAVTSTTTASTVGGRGKVQDGRSAVMPPPLAPRNFVAEAAAAAAAAAAAKAPAAAVTVAARGGGGGDGPRVSYACRGCRSVLFTEADVGPHEDEERALFAATKPHKKGRPGRRGNDSEASLCNMHFLRKPLAWMEACLQAGGGGGSRPSEGKLACPICASKLGKWTAGPGATGVKCACGVVVAAPAYAVLRARLDILDAQLDIASAVQSTLRAYHEEVEAGDGSGDNSSTSSGDEAPGARKKRQKQKRNKTANFSSFRNKNFGFSLKQQKQLVDSVMAATTVDDCGGVVGLGAVREEDSD